MAVGADQLQQHLALIFTQFHSQLRGKGLDRPSTRNVRDGTEPADPRMRHRLAILAAHVRYLEGHIDMPHAGLDKELMATVRREGRQD